MKSFSCLVRRLPRLQLGEKRWGMSPPPALLMLTMKVVSVLQESLVRDQELLKLQCRSHQG